MPYPWMTASTPYSSPSLARVVPSLAIRWPPDASETPPPPLFLFVYVHGRIPDFFLAVLDWAGRTNPLYWP